MAYHGYAPTIGNHAIKFPYSTILEIGVDKGQTLFPVVNYLSRVCYKYKRAFCYAGIDVEIREDLKIAVDQINLDIHGPPSNPKKVGDRIGFVELYEENSLNKLPKLLAHGLYGAFSVILVDGDHNYHTVSQELEYASKLVALQGLIICDDYDGPGGIQDEFFSEHPEAFEEENKHVKSLLKREDIQNKEKQGVKLAVDEFIENNKEWAKHKIFPDLEPVILYRKDKVKFSTQEIDTGSGGIAFHSDSQFL